MVTIYITEDQRNRAKHHYQFHKLRNSITGGESEIYGALGEIIVYDYYSSLGKSVEWSKNEDQQYNWDLSIDGLTYDIKTKRTTVIPQENYLCSVAAVNITQKCDYYYFVRVTEDLMSGYLLGYYSKSEFYSVANFKIKGEPDGENWVIKDDCYNLRVDQLINVYDPEQEKRNQLVKLRVKKLINSGKLS